MLEKIKTLGGVNDCSERAVKLIQDYANILTKDEDQKLNLLQCIKKNFQNSNEKLIVERFKVSYSVYVLYLKRIIFSMTGK